MSSPEQAVYRPPVVPGSTPQLAKSARRPIPSLVTTAAIVAAFLLLVLVQVLVASTYSLVTSGLGSLASVAVQVTGQALPVVVVVVIVGFLFFWGVAPIHGGLRIGQVIGRSLVCAITVGVVLAAMFFVQFLILVSSPAQSQLGSPSLHDFLRNATQSTGEAVDYFAQTVALIVLGAVLLWNWSRTHPVKPRPFAA